MTQGSTLSLNIVKNKLETRSYLLNKYRSISFLGYNYIKNIVKHKDAKDNQLKFQ